MFWFGRNMLGLLVLMSLVCRLVQLSSLRKRYVLRTYLGLIQTEYRMEEFISAAMLYGMVINIA
jgi:hypothetical protein